MTDIDSIESTSDRPATPSSRIEMALGVASQLSLDLVIFDFLFLQRTQVSLDQVNILIWTLPSGPAP
jgi:hypothetical protein